MISVTLCEFDRISQTKGQIPLLLVTLIKDHLDRQKFFRYIVYGNNESKQRLQ
jgi:hypothetical protein